MYDLRKNSGGRGSFTPGILASFAVLCLAVFSLASCATKLSINFPEGDKVTVVADSKGISHSELLENIYSEETARDGLLSWLADKDVFSMEDRRLAEALNQRLCDPIPQEPLDERIKSADDCASQPVAEDLRGLVERRDVPFHYVGKHVDVGVQNDEPHRPNDGEANVCGDSELFGRTLELTDEATGGRIEVAATRTYTCEGYAKYPGIQLNGKDAAKLFQKPLDKYQRAIVVILPESS